MNDPFRVVIFDDIRQLMFEITSDDTKLLLIQNFLNLLSCNFNLCLQSNDRITQDAMLYSYFESEESISNFLKISKADHFSFPLKLFPFNLSKLNMKPREWDFINDRYNLRLLEELGKDRFSFIQ